MNHLHQFTRTELSRIRLYFVQVALCCMALMCGLVHANEVQSERFVLKLKNSVELSESPSVRRLEAEGQSIAEVLERNGVEAYWLRAGTLGSHVLVWGESVRPSDRQALINRLASDPDVEYVFEDKVLQPMVSSNDPRFNDQWALRSAASVASGRFDRAWDTTRGSADVVVAVVDTGVVFETQELAGRLLAGYDFISNLETGNDGDGRDADASDPGDWVDSSDQASSTFDGCSISDSSWHGTFIAAQIAANTDNGSRVAGADWNAKILPVRVSGKCRAYSSDLFDGMLWAAGLTVPGVPNNPNPADVINVSLGADTTCNGFHQSVMDSVNSTGAVITAAAGNGGGTAFLPANCSGVLSVGALDKDGTRAFYSAIGNTVDLVAPGGYFDGLLGVGNSGSKSPGSSTLVVNTGTSFSAPLVAAAASLVKQINPSLSSSQVRQILVDNTRDFVVTGRDQCTPSDGKKVCDCNTSTCGSGMLDAEAAVAAARTSIPVANASVSLNAGVLDLDGTLSQVSAGRTVASYAWTQVAGETVLSGTSSSAQLNLNAPGSNSDVVFQLTVTDSVGEQHTALAGQRTGNSTAPTTVPLASSDSSSATSDDTAPAPASTSAPTGGGGGGGGALNLLGLLALMGLLRARGVYGFQRRRERC